MAIRVLRLIEYVYVSPEEAEKDMARWTHGVPTLHSSMKMRSATLPFETVDWVTTITERVGQ